MIPDDYSKESKEVINTLFTKTGIKFSEDDPFIVLFVEIKHLFETHAFRKEDLIVELDKRINKLQLIADTFQDQKSIIITELANQNKKLLEKELMTVLISYQKKYLFFTGVLSLICLSIGIIL